MIPATFSSPTVLLQRLLHILREQCRAPEWYRYRSEPFGLRPWIEDVRPESRWDTREGAVMIVASEEIEFIGGGPLDGAVEVWPPQSARITHCRLIGAGPYVTRIEAHVYVRYGPRRDGGSYYRYLGEER